MPDTTEKIRFEHMGIGEVIANNRLAVPLNQREYSWEKEHVKDLLDDFANAIAENKSTYFLGAIVLTKGEDPDIPEVSDGQQRLATTTILLAAIRDYFFRHNDEKRAKSIETEYLTKTDIETTADVPKLRLNLDDNLFFTRYVLASPDSPERKTALPQDPRQRLPTSHKRIMVAAQLAAEQVAKIANLYGENAVNARLFEWIKWVRNSAQVIILHAPDHLNAFVMFETLNDRGRNADQSDLLKNYLLSHAQQNHLREAQQKWARMVGVLESLGQDDVIASYLHHLIITKAGPTIARDVYEKVRNQVSSQSQSLVFLNELAEGANDYAALFNADHRKWNDYGTSTRKHITTINVHLKVAQIRPLMFAVSRHFSVKEAQIAFRLFVFWSVRFLIVGGRGGLLDTNYAKRAQEIASGKITTAKALTDALADILPSDARFEEYFSDARVSQVFLARYYLRALETKKKGEAEPELLPSDEETFINLEHILPENPDAQGWPDIDSDSAAANYKRIGNLVLLQAKKNVQIGNKSFADKKQVLKDSAFLLTSSVAACDNWGVEEIEDRQKTLAKLAVETWPIRF